MGLLEAFLLGVIAYAIFGFSIAWKVFVVWYCIVLIVAINKKYWKKENS